MNPTELSDAVSEGKLTFKECMDELAPLVGKYSRKFVNGMDPEDIRQEAAIVIWQCWQRYDRTKGSFLNLVIRSLDNKMGYIRSKSQKYSEPISGLECESCGVKTQRRGRRIRCESCGEHRWKVIRERHGLLPLQVLQESVDPMGHVRPVTGMFAKFAGHDEEGYADTENAVDAEQQIDELLVSDPALFDSNRVQ